MVKGISPSGMLVLSVACLFFVSRVAATLVHIKFKTLALLIETSFLVHIKFTTFLFSIPPLSADFIFNI